MMSETLYSFIQRTLVAPEYKFQQGQQEFEKRLLAGEEKLRPMEMSWVVSPPLPSTRIREIIK
jgi:hypothetical protein